MLANLSAPQNIFLNGLNTKYRAYVGGFGSGKTFVGCLDLLIFFLKHPKTKQGYFAPTYPAIRDIFFPTFDEACELLGFTAKFNESNKEVHVYKGRLYYGTVICRSMEKPNTIVGFKISRALVDEIDILPKKKAEQAWRKIIARMRLKIDGVQNGIGVTTTPEGFMFVYDQFANEPTASYSMVQASTYENEDFLPDDYIETLKESYPENLIEAYINGQFVNLTSGSVYTYYDRVLNGCRTVHDDYEPLGIGLDFNVGNMNALVHVERDGNPHAVDEITGVLDTPSMINVIKARYNTDQTGRSINIYPDASGNSRKTNDASITDIAQLTAAGFTVHTDPSNPAVKDRINCVQAMFCNAKGERRYMINADRCPKAASNFEQQVYNDNGEPDKKSGHDHMPDAAGYFIYQKYPIIKPVTDIRLRMAL